MNKYIIKHSIKLKIQKYFKKFLSSVKMHKNSEKFSHFFNDRKSQYLVIFY